MSYAGIGGVGVIGHGADMVRWYGLVELKAGTVVPVRELVGRQFVVGPATIELFSRTW